MKFQNLSVKRLFGRVAMGLDFETTPYLSRPNPKSVPDYSDYEHLARVKEWSVVDTEDKGE